MWDFFELLLDFWIFGIFGDVKNCWIVLGFLVFYQKKFLKKIWLVFDCLNFLNCFGLFLILFEFFDFLDFFVFLHFLDFLDFSDLWIFRIFGICGICGIWGDFLMIF